jgi:tagatose-6-phosphate ketose/aldose isomerase
MLLVGILISDINNLEQKASIIRDIQSSGGYILENSLNKLRELARTKIDRVVFLGSGPLLGVAEESHLKVQELTCGKVICKFDSFLGFRHGPIAVVDTSTIVFSLLSKDPYVRQYEVDLIRSLKETAPGPLYVCIGDICDSDNSDHGLTIRFLDKTRNIPDEYLSVLYVLPAQILGFYKSLYLNLSPDFPSKNGMITRVVEGVKIYSRSVEV